jgi:hypothetical protein
VTSAPRRRRLQIAFACAALVGLGLVTTAPPGPRPTRTAPMTIAAPVLARGVVHVHTTRSDGSGTVEEVAVAAAQAGLQFVVLTDHGDGTRPPLAPAYHAGVLVLDGVEISTDGGHYVAIGLATAPYRLAGAPADVVADVHRLGGFGFAAHPDSSKPELAWQDWQAPIDGLEWFNLDSEWRDDSTPRLLPALVHYPLRPLAAIGGFLGHGGALLPRWAELAKARRVVGVVAVDAHARLGTEGGFDEARISLRVPSYATLFATAQVSLELDAPLSGDASRDSAAVLRGLREGRSYSTIAARARAGRLAITAERGGVTARMGQFLGGAGRVRVTVEGDAPDLGAIRIVCDGKTMTQTLATSTFSPTIEADEAGHACQAVAGWAGPGPDQFVTWAVTNPIYLRAADPAPTPAAAPMATRSEVFAVDTSRWAVEHSPGSRAEIVVPIDDPGPGRPPRSRAAAFRFALAEGARASQYAAFATDDIGTLSWAQWLRLRLSATAPMRVSIQLREPLPGGDAHRWARSIVIGPEDTPLVVPIAEFRAVGNAAGPPPVGRIRSLLVVVDTVNTPPGRSGELELRELVAEAR